MAWAAADCSDQVLAKLLDSVSSFGYKRVGQRELPEALRALEAADADKLQESLESALILVDFAASREAGAIRSIKDIFTGSDEAGQLINNYTSQWDMYNQSLQDQVLKYAQLKAEHMNTQMPQKPEGTADHAR